MAILRLSGLSRGWKISILVLIGVLCGSVVVLGRITNALSYLSEAPETCMNCHVMTDAYVTWQRGSHGRKAAVCVDCHVPHSNPVAKMAFKGMDGARHTYVYVTHQEPQVMRLSEGAVPVVQANCVRCHSDQLEMIRLAGVEERRCWDCHSNIHGEAHSLSSSPKVLQPEMPAAGLGRTKKGTER